MFKSEAVWISVILKQQTCKLLLIMSFSHESFKFDPTAIASVLPNKLAKRGNESSEPRGLAGDDGFRGMIGSLSAEQAAAA